MAQCLPSHNWVSSIYFPREILVLWRMDCTKQCWVLQGAYCMVHYEPSWPSNTMVVQTDKDIALGPMGNLQGIVQHRSFTPLPMPDRVIKRVMLLELRKQGHVFRFLNRKKEPYKWTDGVREDEYLEFQGLLKYDEEAKANPDISTPSYWVYSSNPRKMITLPSQRNQWWISTTWQLQRLTTREMALMKGSAPREIWPTQQRRSHGIIMQLLLKPPRMRSSTTL